MELNDKEIEEILRKLPDREIEILKLICRGFSHKKIEEALEISHRTSIEYMRRVYRDFGLTSRGRTNKRTLLITHVCPVLKTLEENSDMLNTHPVSQQSLNEDEEKGIFDFDDSAQDIKPIGDSEPEGSDTADTPSDRAQSHGVTGDADPYEKIIKELEENDGEL